VGGRAVQNYVADLDVAMDEMLSVHGVKGAKDATHELFRFALAGLLQAVIPGPRRQQI
jgi:hypothetical protein